MSGARKVYKIEWTGPQVDEVVSAIVLRIEALEDARRVSWDQDGCDLESERIESEVLARALRALRIGTGRTGPLSPEQVDRFVEVASGPSPLSGIVRVVPLDGGRKP